MLGAPAVRVRLFVGISADRQAADFLVKEKHSPMIGLLGSFGDLLMGLVGVLTLCVAGVVVFSKGARNEQFRKRQRQRIDFWGYD